MGFFNGLLGGMAAKPGTILGSRYVAGPASRGGDAAADDVDWSIQVIFREGFASALQQRLTMVGRGHAAQSARVPLGRFPSDSTMLLSRLQHQDLPDQESTPPVKAQLRWVEPSQPEDDWLTTEITFLNQRLSPVLLRDPWFQDREHGGMERRLVLRPRGDSTWTESDLLSGLSNEESEHDGRFSVSFHDDPRFLLPSGGICGRRLTLSRRSRKGSAELRLEMPRAFATEWLPRGVGPLGKPEEALSPPGDSDRTLVTEPVRVQ